jgi:hypothetical protein
MCRRRLLVSIVSAAATLAPFKARAEFCVVLCDRTPTLVALGLLGGSVVVGGLVTDVQIMHDLDSGRSVRPTPAISGIVLWSITTAVLLPATLMIATADNADSGAVFAMVAADVLAISSLGLSIYGVARPRVHDRSSRWLHRVGVLPAAATERGLAPGLTIAFRL